MSIDDKEIEYLANLARLDLSAEEKALIKDDLNKIVGYMDKLESLDVEDVEPMSHVLEMSNRFREDKVQQRFSKEEALKNSKGADGDYFKVPKVIKRKG